VIGKKLLAFKSSTSLSLIPPSGPTKIKMFLNFLVLSMRLKESSFKDASYA
jgi:hypothetical protein